MEIAEIRSTVEILQRTANAFLREFSETSLSICPRAPSGVLGSPGLCFRTFRAFGIYIISVTCINRLIYLGAPEVPPGTLGARWPARVGEGHGRIPAGLIRFINSFLNISQQAVVNAVQ